MKHTIVIELPTPEPDPPDTECIVCGGVVPGWMAPGSRPGVCHDCHQPVPWNWPRFRSPIGHPFWDSFTGLYDIRDTAGVALWHLEREIERQKSI